MSDLLLDRTMGGINAALNLRLANQTVITSNIANADTPGYHAKKMEFDEVLRDSLEVGERLAMEAQDKEHFSISEPSAVVAELYDNPNGEVNLDGNTVDRNAEQVSLAENQIAYNAGTELMKKKLALLKYAVTEGGR